MIFWASSETQTSTSRAVTSVRRSVEPHLNAAFAESSLSAIDAKIRYVPIVMDEETRTRYPARSRLRKKERIYDCAPQLDHDVFVDGAWEDQVACYLDGLRECATRLPELGATKVQAQEFLDILERAKLELSQASGVPPAIH